MNYCGVDVSMKSTHVYIEDGRGRRVHRSVVMTTADALVEVLKPYRRDLRVAIEAGGQTAWIVDVLRALGAAVHVVHPVKVKWIAESKKKTDRVDAELLARLLRIGGLPAPVYVPSRPARELRGLLLARRQLVQIRTKLINVVRGLVRQQQVTLPARALMGAAGVGAARAPAAVHGRPTHCAGVSRHRRGDKRGTEGAGPGAPCQGHGRSPRRAAPEHSRRRARQCPDAGGHRGHDSAIPGRQAISRL